MNKTKNVSADLEHYRFIHETIKLCATYGVKSISVGDLRVEFGVEAPSFALANAPIEKEVESIKGEPMNKEVSEAFMDAQMMIDNPVEYEEMLIRQQLSQGVTDEYSRTQ